MGGGPAGYLTSKLHGFDPIQVRRRGMTMRQKNLILSMSLIASLTTLVAAEKPWPQKGDVVYIAATLAHRDGVAPTMTETILLGPALDVSAGALIPIPPCERLTMFYTKHGRDERYPSWIFHDALGSQSTLAGS